MPYSLSLASPSMCTVAKRRAPCQPVVTIDVVSGAAADVGKYAIGLRVRQISAIVDVYTTGSSKGLAAKALASKIPG